MKVAVTGSSGYLAKYVIDELVANGHSIRGIDLREPSVSHDRVDFVHADCTSLSQMQNALAGCEAVIHTAGIPHPLDRPADEVYHANATGSFVTAWSAGQLGIKRFILASSESVLGNAFHPSEFTPDYLPIDEAHPMLPIDPYGISKIAAEQAVERCATRFQMSAVSLRMPWIWGIDDAERLALYRSLSDNYPQWKKNMWAFVDARDAASAFRLALTARVPEGEFIPYFLVADQHWVAPRRTTESLLDEFYPGVHLNRDPDKYAAFISNVKAKVELGWHPTHGAQALLQGE